MKKIYLSALAAVMILAVMTGSSFAAGNYWDKWTKTISLDMFPD